MNDSGEKRLKSALLIIDMMSDWEFAGGEQLFEHAISAAENIAAVRSRAAVAEVPTIFVNDNYGKWREDFERQVSKLSEKSERGGQIVEILTPGPDDYYVLKPQRSGFYQTALSTLLKSLEVSRLVITGVTTDICVLFTAHDAHMRGYSLVVPSDCCAAIELEHHESALTLLGRVTDADTRPSGQVDFKSVYAT